MRQFPENNAIYFAVNFCGKTSMMIELRPAFINLAVAVIPRELFTQCLSKSFSLILGIVVTSSLDHHPQQNAGVTQL